LRFATENNMQNKERQNLARLFSPLFTLSFLSHDARDFYVGAALDGVSLIPQTINQQFSLY